MHRKAQLIDSIMHINRSAEPAWLARFDVPALARYLEHLQHGLEPRGGGGSFWQRDGETAAVVTRRKAS